MDANTVMRVLIESCEPLYIRSYPHYCEPGYNSENGVLSADWNRNSSLGDDSDLGPRALKIAERAGIGAEWLDEWAQCDVCLGAVRTEPDSYGWTRSYFSDDYGTIVCRSCALDDVDSYIDAIKNCAKRCDTFGVDLTLLGWTEVESGESGFHEGQDSCPEKMIERVYDGHEYVFQIDGKGQFEVSFTLWEKLPE